MSNKKHITAIDDTIAKASVSGVLQKISGSDGIDHDRYLRRMDKYITSSSKSLLAGYVKGASSILDAGCGSGGFTRILAKENPGSQIYAVEANPETYEKARLLRNEFPNVHVILSDITGYLKTTDTRFDAVVFSSVLHEISSYARAPERFTPAPIYEALGYTGRIMERGGTIVIRDGLEPLTDRYVQLNFKNPEDKSWYWRFIDECPFLTDNAIRETGMFETYDGFLVPATIAKEFLCTYTWGKHSWEREIQEKFCILSLNEWMETLIATDFMPVETHMYAEEYAKYLDSKIDTEKLSCILGQMSVTIVAKSL